MSLGSSHAFVPSRSSTIAPAIPPAAQMLMSPSRASRRAISLASVVTMRPPVAAQGWPTAIELPHIRFKSGPEKVLIVTDDINLPPGSVRIRKSGGPGGHNGLKSIITALGTNEFPRVRIGVGTTEVFGGQVDHVLGTFEPATLELVKAASVRASDAITMVVSGGIDNAMNQFNGKVAGDENGDA